MNFCRPRLPNDNSFRIAVTGGTGEFVNAGGQAALKGTGPNTTKATVYLTS